MLCPQCGKDLEIRNVPKIHMESYGKPCTVATLCCGKAVRLTPVFTYTAVAVKSRSNCDDWGHKFSK